MSKSISEEFKDQKINDLLEDYIHLQNELKSIPEKLHDSLHAVSTAIDSLPSHLEVGINKLASAVEEAERSFDKMGDEHRTLLNNQLDEAKLEIRTAIKNEISSGVSDTIKDIQKEVASSINIPLQESISSITVINRKLNSVSDNFQDKRSAWIIGTLLAIGVVSIVTFATISYVAYSEIRRLEIYFNGYSNQKATLERLPKNVQKQFADELQKYLNE